MANLVGNGDDDIHTQIEIILYEANKLKTGSNNEIIARIEKATNNIKAIYEKSLDKVDDKDQNIWKGLYRYFKDTLPYLSYIITGLIERIILVFFDALYVRILCMILTAFIMFIFTCIVNLYSGVSRLESLRECCVCGIASLFESLGYMIGELIFGESSRKLLIYNLLTSGVISIVSTIIAIVGFNYIWDSVLYKKEYRKKNNNKIIRRSRRRHNRRRTNRR